MFNPTSDDKALDRQLQADAWEEGHRMCVCQEYWDKMAPCVNPYKDSK